MSDSTVNELDMDIFDELFALETSLGLNFENHDPTVIDNYFLDDLMENHPISSDESYAPVNAVVSSSHDIPTNPKEWMVTDRTSRRKRPPRLFEFLIRLLQKPHYASYASYKDKSLGIFEIHEPDKVAYLWEQVKNRQSTQKMTYDKFARAIRWYYKDKIMKKTNTRYTFQFSSKTLREFIIDENNNTVMDYSNVN